MMKAKAIFSTSRHDSAPYEIFAAFAKTRNGTARLLDVAQRFGMGLYPMLRCDMYLFGMKGLMVKKTIKCCWLERCLIHQIIQKIGYLQRTI